MKDNKKEEFKMDNVKIEVAERYVEMVKRHKQEALEMVKELSKSTDLGEFEETFYEISEYNNSLYMKLEIAKIHHRDMIKKQSRKK